MMRIAMNSLGLIVAFVAWLILASWLICFYEHLSDFRFQTYYAWSFWPDSFVWPYTQWFAGLRYWGADSRYDMALILSGILPALLVGFLAVALMVKSVGLRRSLYGNSRWASKADMRRNGIH